MGVPKGKPLEFDQPVKRRMFHPLDFWNIHDAPDGLFVENLAARREHLPQLERQRVRKSPASGAVNRRLLFGWLSVKAARLKQDWNSAGVDNRLHLFSVQSNNFPGLPFDVRPGDERHIFSQYPSGPPYDFLFLRDTQIIHVARVHVYCVHQPRAMRS